MLNRDVIYIFVIVTLLGTIFWYKLELKDCEIGGLKQTVDVLDKDKSHNQAINNETSNDILVINEKYVESVQIECDWKGVMSDDEECEFVGNYDYVGKCLSKLPETRTGN